MNDSAIPDSPVETTFFELIFIKYVQKSCTVLSNKYCKIASFNTSHLEAHVGSFRLLMKGIFGPYVL